MDGPRRRRIVDAFSAACEYDRHARVQQRTAQALAERIGALDLPRGPRVLEIGCGTGHLTEALLNKEIGGSWLVTDIAPQMVARCRARIGDREGLAYAVVDGEAAHDGFEQRFDLVCSNLAAQWFDDLRSALERMLGWLRPGGHLLFTTLGDRTFSEWREAHEREGLAPGTPELWPAARLAGLVPAAQASPPVVEHFRERHPTAAALVRPVKGIGGGTPRARHRPLAPAQLRRVMRHFESAGGRATYEVVTCHYRRPLRP